MDILRKSQINRWTCLIAAIWLQSVNGTNFVFSLYSSDLKTVLNINQTKLNSLAVASDLGKTMGWISGLACAYLPTWAVLFIASLLGFLGYGFQWLILCNVITDIRFWQVYIACVMAGNSICWFNTVTFKAAIENFPSTRGMASGLVTSYAGLSTVIFTCISSLFSDRSASFYLLLNCIAPALVSAITGTVFHFCAPSEQSSKEEEEEDYSAEEKTLMLILTLVAITTAGFSISYEFMPRGKLNVQAAFMAVLILLLVAIPLCVPAKFLLKTRTKVVNACSPSVSPESLVRRRSIHLQIEEHQTEIKNAFTEPTQNAERPKLGEEHGITDLLSSIDFWIYYFVYLCGGTVGIVYMNNLGQIVEALGFTKTPLFVSLVSSFGFFGRIAAGLPDFLQTSLRRAIPRPVWMGLWILPMAAAFFALSAARTESTVILWVSTAIVGASSGAITTLAMPISSEMFGVKNLGVNHNIVITNIALGSVAFGEGAARVYDRAAQKEIKEGTINTEECLGSHCYRSTFILWGAVCCAGVFMSILLSLRSRKLYSSQHDCNPHRHNQHLPADG